MKYWPGGSYLVMNNTPIVPGSIPLMVIGHKYNYSKFLGFIANEGAGSTKPGDSYLSCFPENFQCFCLPCCPPSLTWQVFIACNAIENHNRMWQSDITLEKYWVPQSVYFRPVTTVALGMGINNGKSLFCNRVSEGNVDRKISTKEYNNRAVYDCFKNTFVDDFLSQL